MRRLLALVLLGFALTACGHDQWVPVDGHPPHATCSPPAGGRCAADIAWPGAIHLTADGRRLHGIVLCGGTLAATETGGRVHLRLHVGAMAPGTMSCARVDVGVRLAAPLGTRSVYDEVSGQRVRVIRAR